MFGGGGGGEHVVTPASRCTLIMADILSLIVFRCFTYSASACLCAGV